MPPDMKFPFNNDSGCRCRSCRRRCAVAKRNVRNFQVIGRLAPGVTLAQARAEMQNIAAQLAARYPDTNKDYPAQRHALQRRWRSARSCGPIFLVADGRGRLRAADRVRERRQPAARALGAAARARSPSASRSARARWRIVRQLLVESVLLVDPQRRARPRARPSSASRLFDRAPPPDVGKPYWMTFTMDPIVFAFFAGDLPGDRRPLRSRAGAARLEDRRQRGAEGRRRPLAAPAALRARRWTSALIVVEVALTLVLLAGAGFMMRSFLTLYQRWTSASNTSHLLTMRLTLPLTKYPRAASRASRFSSGSRSGCAPSARSRRAASRRNPPLFGGFRRQLVDRRPSRPRRRHAARGDDASRSSAGYFDDARRARSSAGRDFDASRRHARPRERDRQPALRGDALRRRGSDRPPHSADRRDPARVSDAAPPLDADDRRHRRRPCGSATSQDPSPDPVVYVPYRADPQRFVVAVVRDGGDPGGASRRWCAKRCGASIRTCRSSTSRRWIDCWRSSAGRSAMFGSMFADLRGHRAGAVGGRPLRGDRVLGDAADAGDRRPDGARRAAAAGAVAGAAPLAHSARVGLPLGIARRVGVGTAAAERCWCRPARAIRSPLAESSP